MEQPDGEAAPPGPAPSAPSPPPAADLGPRVLAAVGWATFGLFVIDHVGQGPLRRLDEPLMQVIPHAGTLHTISSLATDLGDPVVLAAFTLLGTLILLKRRAFIDAGVLALAMAVNTTIVRGLKVLFERPRPFMGPEAGVPLSFPSGHATGAAMVFMLLAVLLFGKRAKLRPWAEGVAIGLALVIGSTRTILALHWPSDVVAGWGLGWALAGSFLLLRSYLHGRSKRPWAMPSQTETSAASAGARVPEARAVGSEGSTGPAPPAREPRVGEAPRARHRWRKRN